MDIDVKILEFEELHGRWNEQDTGHHRDSEHEDEVERDFDDVQDEDEEKLYSSLKEDIMYTVIHVYTFCFV